jgi:hypothetical protein
MLIAAVERDMGIAGRLAGLIADPRNSAFITHSVADIFRARMLAIACGYEDAETVGRPPTEPSNVTVCNSRFWLTLLFNCRSL